MTHSTAIDDHPAHDQHGNGHGHAHPPLPAPSRQGSVVLDIGAGTGALVIHTTSAEDALEIHVSPVDLPEQRTHAAVRPRHLPGRTLYAAVITPLPAGRYTVWSQDDTTHGSITVTGGHVSDYRWT
ncbi:phospholipase [Streptacidiphilus fuscans]|uniref:Phospholipase n=1 Tax=Streptacidiphilus fuscans TaxID=2789292 RepID=A0A931FB17_9ACTN|nr:phospholipase [Streptacidiphilus fuscans]MBF9066978.1 phospholipase [Streptacidiphilus fuscans]